MKRSDFIYMDPQGIKADFAQCKSCLLWYQSSNTCSIHPADIKITGSFSCNLYLYGSSPGSMSKPHRFVTPEESGLVNRQVRCQNCSHFESVPVPSRQGSGTMVGAKKANTCRLFTSLAIPAEVNEYGCCSANHPISDPKEEIVKNLK